MTIKDHLIECLKALCRANGGPEGVAEASGVSAENLKQIIGGTKLPSGRPRGVGPGVQSKLDAAFPGWARLPSNAPGGRPALPGIDQAVEALAAALAAEMRDEVREDVADALAKLARRKGSAHDRQQVLHFLALPIPPEVAAAISGDPGTPEDPEHGHHDDHVPTPAPAKRPGRHTATARPTRR